jgi:hypothetical protein
MRFFGVLLLGIMIGQTAHALDAEGEEWVKQMRKATDACVKLFDRKFGDVKSTRFADCMTDQTAKATETCIGVRRNEFASCVSGRTLKVMEACDLTRC